MRETLEEGYPPSFSEGGLHQDFPKGDLVARKEKAASLFLEFFFLHKLKASPCILLYFHSISLPRGCRGKP
jgi:hypothetical protein